MVDRDPASRAYRLGWRLYALAARSGRPRLIALGGSVLHGLVAESGETAHLSVLQGGEVMTLLSEAPAYAITANGWSGRTVPVICTSAGRALLFDHDLPTLEKLVRPASFAGLGPGAPSDVTELYRRIEAGRDRGYATVDEEFEDGLVGVAAPVRDLGGRILAAINVSGPKFRLGGQLSATGEAVRDAAQDLTEAMFSPSRRRGHAERRAEGPRPPADQASPPSSIEAPQLLLHQAQPRLRRAAGPGAAADAPRRCRYRP